MRPQAGAKAMGGRRLADRADIVLFALDRQQRGLADRGGVHRPAMDRQFPLAQQHALEHHVDRFQVEFLGHVEDREIFLVESLDLVGLDRLAVGQQLIEFAMLRPVPFHVHRHEGGQLQESGIDLAPAPGIAERHGGDQILLEPFDRLLVRQFVDHRRRRARIDRPAHQGHRPGRRRILILGHQRHGGECRHTGLAH